MELDFVNRTAELKELDAHAKAGGLLVVFGRRRVGKTRLLTQWLSRRRLYSQTIRPQKGAINRSTTTYVRAEHGPRAQRR